MGRIGENEDELGDEADGFLYDLLVHANWWPSTFTAKGMLKMIARHRPDAVVARELNFYRAFLPIRGAVFH